MATRLENKIRSYEIMEDEDKFTQLAHQQTLQFFKEIE